MKRAAHIILPFLLVAPMASNGASWLIDDRSSGSAQSALGTSWRLVTDQVMGGVSQGRVQLTRMDGRACLRLTGTVSLENNGGFVQASLDLSPYGASIDASGYAGIELDVFGNGEPYNLHLRTADTWIVWQSYRASFAAPPMWQTVRLPFNRFAPYRTRAPLDLASLKRIGLVAIGRDMQADLCVSRLALYP